MKSDITPARQREPVKRFILNTVSRLCRLNLKNSTRLWLSDKFYYKLKPEHTMVDLSVGGLTVRLDISEFQQRLIYFGNYENELIEILPTLVEPQGDIIDVGAHVGFVSAWLLKASPASTIYAFEPNPLVHGQLEALAKSSKGRIKPFNLAISDKAGELTMHFDPAASMLSTAIDTIKPTGSIARAVPCITLDEVVFHRKLWPRLIKIDAEGAEPAILRGAMRTFELYLPTIICEFKPWLYGEADVETLRRVLAFGYLITPIGQVAHVELDWLLAQTSDVNAVLTLRPRDRRDCL